MTKGFIDSAFDGFFAQNNGKYISILSPGRQCFDLPVAFTDKLGIPHYPGNPSPFPYANAYEIYTKFGDFQAKYFTRVPNTPDYVPQKADILVWDKGINGGIGHVALGMGQGDINLFKSFDQNFPTGSACHVQPHGYNYLLGCLRLITSSDQQPPMNNDARKAGQFNGIVNALYAAKKVPTDNSDALLDGDPVLGAVKNLLKDLSDCQAGSGSAKYDDLVVKLKALIAGL